MRSESSGHKALKNTIKKILENSDFDHVDTEVNMDTSNNDGTVDLSIDVCAIYKKTLFIFQCKNTGDIKGLKKEFTSIKQYGKNIRLGKSKVLTSNNKLITTKNLKNIETIKYCYAFTKKLKNDAMRKNVEKEKFIFWDDSAVKYYHRVSNILKQITKDEILKEFNMLQDVENIHKEPAVEIKQKNNSMYLLGMHPGLLLKIAYVYRRTNTKLDAYQRIIKKERIENISKFFNAEKKLMLPNPVIIVFDESDKIQKEINYSKNELTFPISHGSAWIIDGQHRIFGFKDHKHYKKWNVDSDDGFKIPVVVFKKLPLSEQHKTFVNINYNQKSIDSILFNDLSTIIQDLKHEITWPSLLVAKLNEKEPWKKMIKVSEMDTKKSISISGFSKTVLLNTLLGYNKRDMTYSGVLYKIAKFDRTKSFNSNKNKSAFDRQVKILIKFFTIVREHVKDNNPKKDKWLNSKDFGLTKFTSVNALLLVLNALLERDNNFGMNLNKWVKAIDIINFKNEPLLEFGRGYPAMPKIANKIIKKMNKDYNAKLKIIGSKK